MTKRWRESSPSTAGCRQTADSWRRGPYTVLGEARESPGLRRVRTGVDAVRIALFTDSYLPTVDGVVTSVLTTRRQLEAHGHEVVVFAPEDPHRRGKTHGVAVPSRAILEEILALSPSAKIADVIPTGVDTDRFRPDISGQGVRTKWGLNGHDVILHVGRVAPEKNLTTLIHAFPEVLESNPDTKLMIVGTGPYMEKYYDLVRHLGLSGDVIFTGFVPDAGLPKYYAAADAFAIASKFETQGLVVLEALASGRPVAGANYRAIPEFVREGVNW